MKEIDPCGVSPAASTASKVESLIELYAERWNKIGSQAEADQLQAAIEHAATTLAPEQLLAYAAAPKLRGRLLALCVFARAQERAAAPHGGAAAPAAPQLIGTEVLGSDAAGPWDPAPDEGAGRAA